jgi:hypothetical protein
VDQKKDNIMYINFKSFSKFFSLIISIGLSSYISASEDARAAYIYTDNNIINNWLADASNTRIMLRGMSTILMYAAQEGAEIGVRQIIWRVRENNDEGNLRFQINLHDSEKETALHKAVRIARNNNICLELIASGADVNAQDDQGKTALHWAVIIDNENICRTLVAAGADVNIPDKNDMTPLMLSNYYIRGILQPTAVNKKLFSLKNLIIAGITGTVTGVIGYIIKNKLSKESKKKDSKEQAIEQKA